MSYILQALAQSERERRDADAPDLARVFDVETPAETGQRRRTLIFVVLGVLLVNAAVIAALILVGDFEFGGKASTSTAASTDFAPVSAPIPESIPAPQQAASLIEVPPQPINTTPSAPGPSIPIYNTPAKDAATQNKSVEDLPAADINKTATQNVFIEDPPVTEIPVMEPEPIVDEPAEVASQQQVEMLELTGLERVSTLPGIDMSVHVYSENIAERFVFINGQEYHEGDILTAEGAQLAAITPDGIVVDFGDRRVLLSRIR
jgi:hypothetical protein